VRWQDSPEEEAAQGHWQPRIVKREVATLSNIWVAVYVRSSYQFFMTSEARSAIGRKARAASSRDAVL